MKKFITIVLAIVLVLSLAACGASASAESAKDDGVRFQCVEKSSVDSPVYDRIYVYVDTQTGVLYVGSMGSNHSFMTVLVNADGTPMIWEGHE